VLNRPALLVDIAMKILLFCLLALALLRPDLPQFADKGMAARAVFYPLVALLVPVSYQLFLKRRIAFPVLIDICVTLPFFLDTAGNAANLYDTLSYFDDVLHFANWVPWVTAFGLTLVYWPLGRLNVAALTIGFGAVTHILWEMAEYVAFITKNDDELVGIYKDTIGDLGLSLTGSVTGGVLVATVLWSVAHRNARRLTV